MICPNRHWRRFLWNFKALFSPPSLAALVLTCLLAGSAHGQLRIVSYNTATGSGGNDTARAGIETVLTAIGAQIVAGIAKPIDVLLLQEQLSTEVSTQSLVDVLNGIYGAGVYERGSLNGLTSGAGRPGIVYNSQTVDLLGEISFGLVSTSHQARQTLRYELRPIGYGDDAIFHAYNNHYKADDGSADQARRLLEAETIRANADALGQGAHLIYAGDFNIQTANENMYQELLSAGPGQAFDPIDTPGFWHDNNNFKLTHTQSPRSTSGEGLVGAGMDDRFDFQLVSGEFLDGAGLSFIPGTYRAFGNNGTHTLNGAINTGSGASPAVLNALMTASDHLPVVADYQLPAVMQALAGSVPETLELGELFNLEVMVSNAADVVVAIGADLLQYSLTTAGDLTGTFLDQTDAALGSVNMHLISFDTSTPGLKAGTIQIASPSQQVANGQIEIPISYEVIAADLLGDYNGNGVVDAADYSVWRDTLNQSVAFGSGADGNNNGTIDIGDYDVWRSNFGSTTGNGTAVAVPEPASSAVLLAMLVARAIIYCRPPKNRLRFLLE